MIEPCSCGNPKLHVVAERRTADGRRVVGWSNGEVTFGFGLYPAGIGGRRSNVWGAQIRQLVLDVVELYDASELGDLIHAARAAVAQTSLEPRTYIRRRMAGEKFHHSGAILRSRRPT